MAFSGDRPAEREEEASESKSEAYYNHLRKIIENKMSNSKSAFSL